MDYLEKVQERGIKTTWLAEQFGISQPAMYMKLTGKRTLTTSEEQKLAKILDIELNQTSITDKYQYLPEPNCQAAEGAYLLLIYKRVSRKFAMDNAWILNFPDIVHRLRKLGAEITTWEIKKKNRYGRSITYGEYEATNKDKLKEIYLKIVGENEKPTTR